MMEIRNLSYNIAMKIKDANPEETKSVEIMTYSISVLINFFSVLFTSILIGYLSGNLQKTLISFGTLFILRSFSGGVHARTLFGCFLISTLIFTTAPFIDLNDTVVTLFNVTSLILVILFAPLNDEKNNIKEKWYPLLKTISILIVLTNFFIRSEVVAITLLIQSILLIKIRR